MSYLSDIAEAIRREVDPSLLPNEDTDALFRIYAVLALAKGMTVTVEDVHNAWAAWMSGKDPNHPSIQPLGALPQSVQREDAPFVGAIHAVAARLTHCGPHRLNE